MLAGLPAAALAGPAAGFAPQAFGARGDGVADDTAAFRAMHRAMRRAQDVSPGLDCVVRLAPGHYRYAWNRWTWGLRRVTVTGYGAALQCIHPGPFDVDQAPLLSNRDHYWTWDAAGPAYGGSSAGPAEHYGARIATARPGERVLRMLEPYPPLAVGAWVLVQSYAQQAGGYPPNMRCFERARVVAQGPGRVRLDRPLAYLHRDDWPESSGMPGQARLVGIDRPDCPLAVSQQFLGLTFLSNPNHAVRDAGVRRTREVLGLSGALEATVRDCTLIALGVTQCGDVTVAGCSMEYTEPDKLVDRLTFQGCRIGEIRECTGVGHLVLEGCTVQGPAQLLARDVTVRDCTFPASGRGLILDGPVPTRRMAVMGSRFGGAAMEGTVWTRLPIDGRSLRLAGENQVEAAAGSPALATLAARLEIGWPVMAQGPDGPRFGPQFGWCTDITGQGAGAVFAFAFAAPLRRGDVLAFPRLLSLDVRGCRAMRQPAAWPDPPLLTWEDQVTASSRVVLLMRSDSAVCPAWVAGYAMRLRCTVARPYRGSGPACLLRLREEGPDGVELSVDLRQPGVRDVDPDRAMLLPGDRFMVAGKDAQHLPGRRYIGRAVAEIVSGPAAGSPDDQAEFVLDLTIGSPFADAPAFAVL